MALQKFSFIKNAWIKRKTIEILNYFLQIIIIPKPNIIRDIVTIFSFIK
jgi:hypothetical protein